MAVLAVPDHREAVLSRYGVDGVGGGVVTIQRVVAVPAHQGDAHHGGCDFRICIPRDGEIRRVEGSGQAGEKAVVLGQAVDFPHRQSAGAAGAIAGPAIQGAGIQAESPEIGGGSGRLQLRVAQGP